MKHLHLLLDENLPLPKALKYLTKNHNVKHANFVGLKGKDDTHVYMASKAQERILVTYDQNIYTNSRKYKFFADLGLIYLTSKKGSYDLVPEEI